MRNPVPNRKQILYECRVRVQKAREAWKRADAQHKELIRAGTPAQIEIALRIKDAARAEYARELRAFTALLLHRDIPDADIL